MQISKLRRLGVALATVAFVVAACNQGTATTAPGGSASATDAAAACASGTTKIEVQSWWTTGGEATGLEKLFAKFNKDNPTLCAYNAAIAGGAGTNAKAAIKTRTLAGTPPDTFQVHMGHELLDTYVDISAGSVLSPLDTSIIDPSKFPAGVIQIISGKDGKPYTVPVNIHRANVLWYNKKVFSDNNLQPPTTWDEFKTVADTLKGKGITPLAMGGKDNFEAQQVFETVLIGTLGADGYKGLWTGSTDWAGADVTKAIDTFKTVLTYTNNDSTSLTWDQANQMVIDGKAGMTIMGDWADGDYTAKKFTDYGWALAPGNDGVYDALSDTFGLPKGAKHPDGMKAFLTLLGSAEAQDIFNPLKGSIPARIDAGNPPAGEKQYDDYLKSALADWKVDSIVPSLEHGAAAKSSWKSAINDAIVLFQQSGDVAGLQATLASSCKDAGVCS